MSATINTLLKATMPPLLYTMVHQSVVGRTLAKQLRARRAKACAPQWAEVKAGPLLGKRLFFNTRGAWQQEMLEGKSDDFLFEFIKPLDLKGKTVLDIGGHVGYHALSFAQLVGPQGKVLTFEPNPANRKRLELHVKENDFTAQVTVVPLALSNNAGEIEMHCTSDIEGGSSSGGFISGASTYWTDYRVYEQKAGFMSIRVQTVALDNFVLASKECIEPALMKIDVEGAEHLVVQGARKTIEKHRPIILLELHSINCAYEVVSMLKDMRYDIKPLEINKVDGRIFIGCKPLQNISSINE